MVAPVFVVFHHLVRSSFGNIVSHDCLHHSIRGHTQGRDGAPPQNLLHEGSEVREGGLVVVSHKPVVANNTVEFRLCLLLNLRVLKHRENERAHSRDSLYASSVFLIIFGKIGRAYRVRTTGISSSSGVLNNNLPLGIVLAVIKTAEQARNDRRFSFAGSL